MSRQTRNMGIKWDKVADINERAEGKDKDTVRFLSYIPILINSCCSFHDW